VSPSYTKSPGPRPSSIPSDILIHAAIWPQLIWAENWRAVPLWAWELGPHLTECGQDRGLYLHAKLHLDSSNRLATVHERYRQTDRTGPVRDTDTIIITITIIVVMEEFIVRLLHGGHTCITRVINNLTVINSRPIINKR